MMGPDQIGVKLHRLLEFFFGSRPVPVIIELDLPQHRVGIRKRVVEL